MKHSQTADSKKENAKGNAKSERSHMHDMTMTNSSSALVEP